MADVRDYSLIREEALTLSPDARELLRKNAFKRRIALSFARMRAKAKLSQREVGERAGWDKAYVSRLESATASVPDMQTLARFASACGMEVGLFVIDRKDVMDERCVRIVDALAVVSDETAQANPDAPACFDFLVNDRLRIPPGEK